MKQSKSIISKSDYLYLLLMNAIMMKNNVNEKWKFLRDNIYKKGSNFNYAKAIISSASKYDDEYAMFQYILKNMRSMDLLTERKYKELKHIIDIKYGMI